MTACTLPSVQEFFCDYFPAWLQSMLRAACRSAVKNSFLDIPDAFCASADVKPDAKRNASKSLVCPLIPCKTGGRFISFGSTELRWFWHSRNREDVREIFVVLIFCHPRYVCAPATQTCLKSFAAISALPKHKNTIRYKSSKHASQQAM